MPIDVQCGQCQKKYRVADAMAGKKIRCKACAGVMAVPKAGGSEDDHGPLAFKDDPPTPLPPKPGRAPTRSAALPADADPFDLAALAAMESTDPTAPPPPPPPPTESPKGRKVRVRNINAGPGNSSSRSRATTAGGDYGGIGMWLVVFGVSFGIALAYRGYHVGASHLFDDIGTPYMLGAFIGFMGLPIFIMGWLICLMNAFGESPMHGMLSFIPLYVLYYAKTRMREIGAAAVMVIVGLIMMKVGNVIVNNNPPPTHLAKEDTKTKKNQPDNAADDTPTQQPSSPQRNNTVAANSNTGNSANNTVTNPPRTAVTTDTPKTRLTTDGKPIPPPPDGMEDATAATLFPDDPAARPGPTTAPVVHFLERAPLSGVEEVRAYFHPGPWIFGRHGATTWERFNTSGPPDTWKPEGQIDLPEAEAAAIFSPSGEYLVRQAGAGKSVLQAWSFVSGKMEKEINGAGVTGLIGFLNNEQFVVSGGNPTMLVVVNAKTGTKVRDMPAPVGTRFNGPECSVSADGSLIAAPARAEPAPLVLLYSGGGGVKTRIALPVAKGFHPFDEFVASAFSKDGRKLAVMQRSMQSTMLYICGVSEGRVLSTFQYPDSGFDGRNPGPIVQWLADTGCLLLHNTTILDSTTGRVIGAVDRDVLFWHDSGNGKMLATRKDDAGGHTDLCELDAKSLAARLSAAKASGPLQFEWPDLAGPRFSTNKISPKAGEAKLGAPPDPAPASAGKVVESSIPIDAPYSWVEQILFSRAGPPAAVIALTPGGTPRGNVSAQEDPDFKLERIDLATGKAAPPLHLPVHSKLVAISPDANFAVLQSDGGEKLIQARDARLDVLALPAGKPVASFIPYIDAATAPMPAGADNQKASPLTVTWVAMVDADGLLTLNTGQTLIRWSLSGHRAVWARVNVTGTPAISPGGKYIVTHETNALVLVDAKTGDLAGSLAPEPLTGNEAKSMWFSRDGASLFAATTPGLIRWDLSTGHAAPILTPQPFSLLDELTSTQLLLDERLFDIQRQEFIYRYPIPGGRHLSGGSGGRHWYIARTPIDAAPHLCSAVLPGEADLALAAKLAADAPLIRPGKQVALQVNAGGASQKITELLTAKLKVRNLDQGDIVATLKVTATESPTGETREFNHGMNAFARDPNAEKVALQKYECYYDLVDTQDHVLYGTQTAIFNANNISGVSLKSGETVSAKLEDVLQQRVAGWAAGIKVPNYLTGDGRPAPRPERVLGIP